MTDLAGGAGVAEPGASGGLATGGVPGFATATGVLTVAGCGVRGGGSEDFVVGVTEAFSAAFCFMSSSGDSFGAGAVVAVVVASGVG